MLAFLTLLLLFWSAKAWAVPVIRLPEPDFVRAGEYELTDTVTPFSQTLTVTSGPSEDTLTPSVALPKEKLEKVLEELEKDPYVDEEISSTYHPEGCFDFVSEVYQKAGLEVSEVLDRSVLRARPSDGDLLKITNSVFYGLPHWGIYYDGIVYHNWGFFRAEPFQYFLERYALPLSPCVIYHPIFKNPSSLTSQFR